MWAVVNERWQWLPDDTLSRTPAPSPTLLADGFPDPVTVRASLGTVAPDPYVLGGIDPALYRVPNVRSGPVPAINPPAPYAPSSLTGSEPASTGEGPTQTPPVADQQPKGPATITVGGTKIPVAVAVIAGLAVLLTLLSGGSENVTAVA